MFMEPTLDGTQYFLHCDLSSATMAVSLLLDFLCNSNLYNLIIGVPAHPTQSESMVGCACVSMCQWQLGNLHVTSHHPSHFTPSLYLGPGNFPPITFLTLSIALLEYFKNFSSFHFSAKLNCSSSSVDVFLFILTKVPITAPIL